MNFKELIEKRIERFNNFWVRDLGYSFEDEPKVMEKEYKDRMNKWQPKADEAAQKHGFVDFQDFVDKRWKSYNDETNEFELEIPELNQLNSEKPFPPSPLYFYEMNVINQAESVANFIVKKSEELNQTTIETWDNYGQKEDGSYCNSYEFTQNIIKDGYNEWDDGHSGNSASASILFAKTLLFHPNLFPYLHGSLATLVGDKGYHDDRSDIPSIEN